MLIRLQTAIELIGYLRTVWVWRSWNPGKTHDFLSTPYMVRNASGHSWRS